MCHPLVDDTGHLPRSSLDSDILELVLFSHQLLVIC